MRSLYSIRASAAVNGMSASESIRANAFNGPDQGEIKIALAAWGVFLLGTCVYCLIHQAIVSAVTPDLVRTVTLALREWGIWLVLTPFVFNWLQATGGESALARLRDLWPHALLTLLIAMLVEIGLDQATDTRAAASTIAIFLPRYIGALVVVYLVWHVFVRTTDAVAPHEVEEKQPFSPPVTILVSKGADECLLPIDEIQYMSAARNYVEIRARNQCYLLRGTMAQLEELLPPHQFVRIHRSHIVNVREIERIKIHRSGSGTVQLRCGASLGLSKRYRAELQTRRLSSAH